MNETKVVYWLKLKKNTFTKIITTLVGNKSNWNFSPEIRDDKQKPSHPCPTALFGCDILSSYQKKYLKINR